MIYSCFFYTLNQVCHPKWHFMTDHQNKQRSQSSQVDVIRKHLYYVIQWFFYGTLCKHPQIQLVFSCLCPKVQSSVQVVLPCATSVMCRRDDIFLCFFLCIQTSMCYSRVTHFFYQLASFNIQSFKMRSGVRLHTHVNQAFCFKSFQSFNLLGRMQAQAKLECSISFSHAVINDKPFLDGARTSC